VQGIGIDSEGDKYKVTVDIFDADSSEEELKSKIVQSQGDSVSEALSNISSQTGEQLLYSQNFVILIGEEVARRGTNEIIDFFVRHYEARPSVSIFSVNGPAADVMRCNFDGKPVTSQNIEDIAKADFLNAKDIGSNVLKFVSSIKNETSDPKTLSLKLVKTEDKEEKKEGTQGKEETKEKEETVGEEETQSKEKEGNQKKEINSLESGGIAVFSGDKLKGFLNKEENLGAVLLASCKVKDLVRVLDIPDVGKVSFNITDSNSELSTLVENSTVICNIDVNVSASIYEFDKKGHQNIKKLENHRGTLEEEISKNLNFCIWRAIDKVILQYESDIFCIGQRLFKSDPDHYRELSKNWKEAIRNGIYFVKVHTKLESTGREI
jgi:spore germination protein KC